MSDTHVEEPGDDRGYALDAFVEAEEQAHPEHGIKMALVGIGYALLDVASAIREGAG